MTANFELVTNEQHKQNVIDENNENQLECSGEYHVYVYKRYPYVLYKEKLYKEVHGLFGLREMHIPVSEFLEEFKKWFNEKEQRDGTD